MGKIELPHIETTTAAKNFATLLETKKTYFLNGRWGSGKTEFLGEVQKNSDKKFITLELWRHQDSRTTVTLSFLKLLPVWYWSIRIAIILSVVVSILASNLINIGLTHYLPNFLVGIAGVVALVVAVCQFFKAKSDIFYAWLLRTCSLKNKVLVIDDFDRISEQQQEEAYKVFNLLSGRLPIVFVGDYEKLHLKDTTYLSKIIDRRVELPFALHPSAIWHTYFQDLENSLSVELSSNFKELIVKEQRNLRDREHFNDYINLEFFDRGKLGHVQVEQQLLVIYTYLFHSKYYQNLLDGVDIANLVKEEGGIQEIVNKIGFKQHVPLDDLMAYELKNILLKSNEDYPQCYTKNQSGYYLYEEVSNQSVKELEDIINSDAKLSGSILLGQNTDFYQYLTANFKTFPNEVKNKLFHLTLQCIKKGNTSAIISFVIREKQEEIMPSKKFIGSDGPTLIYDIPKQRINKTEDQEDREILEGWHKLLDDEGFDLSQKLYLWQEYRIFSFHKLGQLFRNINIIGNEYTNYSSRDTMLLTYLSINNLWYKLDCWNEDVWRAIELMNEREFLRFWIMQRILTGSGSINDYAYNPEDRAYTVWTGSYQFDPPHDFVDYTKVVNDKLKPKLDELTDIDYTFEYKIDETCRPNFD